ncbi:MAG: polyketide synthase dehydratase domain-containing protein, partial [Proteobacteria bacterium]|nr:polyketide synthase dehydratase domain-containing protein [Pseudomonadota bacterium]
MTDFIEYVVSELRSKRLSKPSALALIKQFSSRQASTVSNSALHPLLHCNTSDLSQQSYTTVFKGEEFFLKDHQIQDQKVLPGVVYLEMARAAIADALPFEADAKDFELRNLVWAKPFVVNEVKEIMIALFAAETNNDDYSRIEFEIYSIENEEETIHCQGQVVFCNQEVKHDLDLASLQQKMNHTALDSETIYAVFAKMGVNFGPAHQGIQAIHQGENQVLARIRLPGLVRNSYEQYLLHPSLMDSALQAGIGLIGSLEEHEGQPTLPFALDSL